MGRFENGDARRKAQRYPLVSRALTTPQIRFQNGSAIRHLQFRGVYVGKTFKVQYTVSGMTKWLHEHGFSYKEPKLVPAKADAQKQEEFIG